jgi:hypothetical protein
MMQRWEAGSTFSILGIDPRTASEQEVDDVGGVVHGNQVEGGSVAFVPVRYVYFGAAGYR